MCPPRFLELCAYFECRIQEETGLCNTSAIARPRSVRNSRSESAIVGILKFDGTFDLAMLLVEETEYRHGQRALARTALSHQDPALRRAGFQVRTSREELAACPHSARRSAPTAESDFAKVTDAWWFTLISS
jgi:hypothetical protein